MKYSIECSVTGKVMVRTTLHFKKDTKEYFLIPDEHGSLSSIKIIMDVPHSENFSSRTTHGKDGILNILIDGDLALKNQLITEFQQLESLLSFETEGALISISWNKPKEDFIPETDEEKLRFQVREMYFTRDYKEVISYLNQKDFTEIMETKERYIPLTTPMSFYREGANEFHSRRYINAFYNHYFVLEDLYGEGKTKNKDVAHAFKNSIEFRGFVKWLLEGTLASDEKHRTSIKKFCAEEHVSYDLDGLIDLIIKVRGNLHHYSGKSSKHIGTPFTHRDFESIALLTLSLSVRAILQRILKINQTINAV